MKKDAYLKLINEYTSIQGAVTLFPAKNFNVLKNEQDSQNNHLWTGEASILTRLSGVTGSSLMSGFEKYTKDCTIEKGLITRHPDPYRFSAKYDPISLDEYAGVCFSIAGFNLIKDYSYLANEMVEYGVKYNWCFDDREPFRNPYKEFFKNPIDNTKHIIKLIKNKDFKGSKATDKLIEENKAIQGLSRIRLWKDRWLIKLCSNKYNPSLLDSLHNLVSLVHTANKPKEVVSGKVLAFFKFKTASLIGKKSIVLGLTERYFNRKMKKMYGEKYMEDIFKIFYVDKNHPFHTLIKELK